MIIVNYSISDTDCIKLKYEEIFNDEQFERDLDTNIKYLYSDLSYDDLHIIKSMYEEGCIKTNNDLIGLVGNL